MAENSAVYSSLWSQCIRALEADLSEQQFNTWIRPLQPVEDGAMLRLLAPNRFVVDWVKGHCLEQIRSWWSTHSQNGSEVVVEVGSRMPVAKREAPIAAETEVRAGTALLGSRLNPDFTFDNFVEGKSNQLARAAAVQVAENPGQRLQPAVHLRRRGPGQDAPDAGRRQPDSGSAIPARKLPMCIRSAS